MKVVKRDEKRENFDRNKIRAGIERAAKRANVDKDRVKKIADKVARDVENSFRDRDEIRSADIREKVLEALNREERKIANEFRAFRK
jgi:transcriptional repressor NrdR